ncbi:hypothetical protein P3S67_002684 [Capsicum chacoense]
MANWAELPNDLIAQIANRVEDFIALRAVCTSWRSAATKENFDVFSYWLTKMMIIQNFTLLGAYFSQKLEGEKMNLLQLVTVPKFNSLQQMASKDGTAGALTKLSYLGKIYAVDVAQSGAPSISIVEPRLLVEYRLSNQFYLVEVSRALLLVDRYDYIRTPTGGKYSVNFKVLQLDVIKGEFKRISNLGESTIFLDRNGAISVDSSKFKFAGIKPNHIYLIDCRFEFYGKWNERGGKYMRIYNIEDGKFEWFRSGFSLSPACPPTWFTPSIL